MRSTACLLALLAAGCSTPPVTCAPACAPGFACSATGECVPTGDGPDAAMGDAATAGCQPACGGLTPFCSDAGRCVGCLMDAQCPPGQFCKPVGNGASCVPGCNDDSRCGG